MQDNEVFSQLEEINCENLYTQANLEKKCDVSMVCFVLEQCEKVRLDFLLKKDKFCP